METLGFRPDDRSGNEFWIGETLDLGARLLGIEFRPQANSIALLHVDDAGAARAELEAKGVEFSGKTVDTGSATWRPSGP